MNINLFKRITDRLLSAHYGIGINDTHFTEDSEIDVLVQSDTRPYQAVSEYAESKDLDRVDALDLVPKKAKALTAEDEFKAIGHIDGTIELDEFPTLCPKCGARCEIDDVFENLQKLSCLNQICGHEFIAEDELASV